ncbi:type VI secretion system baseplate subunit TssK [Oceanibaculum sp.]|uniref:type VI secretion system baseplate subunit TssK n=1 Tax=Oceanibaculum sp. TaxID=1903597 RepID=UPI00258F5F6A|nr:type VI secretion system baseplate subunit TssK [Oceanibaculum sp.]MCH2395755.1 type VI secretion system baseplate subunit TssK [Oceanibaculum sp.]
MSDSARTIPPLPLKWWEGMLLAPQHMQQQGLRQEMLVAYQAGLLAPCAWGVVRLESSADADGGIVTDGKIAITALEAILPDGTAVSHGPNSNGVGSPVSLSLDLAPVLPAVEGRSLRLYLTLPHRHAGDVSPDSGARFVPVVQRAVPDENTDADPIELTRLAPALALSAGPPPADRSVGLPLMEIAYRNGAYRIAAYVPPSLLCPSGGALQGLCAGIADKVRRQAGGLTALAGAVAAAVPGTLPPRFPSYDHMDALPCVQAVAGFIETTLAGLGGGWRAVPFETGEEGGFRLDIQAGWLAGGLVIGVLPPEGADIETAHRYMGACLVGSESRLQGLRKRRVLGAGRQRLPERDALSIARRPDMAVYRVQPEGEIAAGEALAIGIFQAEASVPPPAGIVLFLPPEKTG